MEKKKNKPKPVVEILTNKAAAIWLQIIQRGK